MTYGVEHQRLGELLLKAGVITEKQLSDALEEQRATGMRLGEILIKNGYIADKQLAQALSAQLKLPLVSLARFRPAPEAVRLVPEAVAKRLEVVPMSVRSDNRLAVAVADPLNIFAIDELRVITGMEVEVSVAPISDIRRALEAIYSVQGRIDEAMVEVANEAHEEETRISEEGTRPDDAPVIKLVNNIIEQAVKEEASDIHIEPFERSTRVRFRVDGMLFDSADFSKNLHPAVISRVKIMANMDITEKRRPQDGRILMKVDGRRIDLRISTLPTINGEKAVIRILDPATAKVGLENLGLDEEERKVIDELITIPYGLILVTGPTGSGKSTTLYSMLETLNKSQVNVVTVEDPVEYTIHGVNQVQVNEKAGLTFGETLRSILRQDPDKIMVGEIRDTETASLAIRAALTGHLVLSTLHTNDAPSSLIRLIDMGIQPFLVASSVEAAMAQRLVRKLCDACKAPLPIESGALERLGLPKDAVTYGPVGCDICRGTGYKGRTGIYEIMVMNEELRHLAQSNAPLGALREAAMREGMRPLRQAALDKVLRGVTSLEEALSVTMQQ